MGYSFIWSNVSAYSWPGLWGHRKRRCDPNREDWMSEGNDRWRRYEVWMFCEGVTFGQSDTSSAALGWTIWHRRQSTAVICNNSTWLNLTVERKQGKAATSTDGFMDLGWESEEAILNYLICTENAQDTRHSLTSFFRHPLLLEMSAESVFLRNCVWRRNIHLLWILLVLMEKKRMHSLTFNSLTCYLSAQLKTTKILDFFNPQKYLKN